MSTLADQPAFPSQELNAQGDPIFPLERGMTYRQWLAGMAMQGLAALMTVPDSMMLLGEAAKRGDTTIERAFAKMSVECADALIAELEKEEAP